MFPPRLRLAAALWGLTLLCARPATAHDFWIQPGVFWPPVGSTLPMTLQVGHGPDRQRSSLPLRRIIRFAAITPQGATLDFRGALSLGGPNADGALSFPAAGAYIVVLQTDDRAQTHLSGARFNAYAKDEGLAPALAQREHSHRMQTDASERYSRQAKVIVNVGPAASAAQTQITRPVGLLMEIVPEASPYQVPRPATLPVRVFYEGRPLANALVKLTDLAHDAEPLDARRTDVMGRASFAMPTSGSWLLNVVWTKPLPEGSEVDFETVFSSLSFGFPTPPS